MTSEKSATITTPHVPSIGEYFRSVLLSTISLVVLLGITFWVGTRFNPSHLDVTSSQPPAVVAVSGGLDEEWKHSMEAKLKLADEVIGHLHTDLENQKAINESNSQTLQTLEKAMEGISTGAKAGFVSRDEFTNHMIKVAQQIQDQSDRIDNLSNPSARQTSTLTTR
jgi:hypothetical protein